MPLTKFDDICALVAIDVQKGIVAAPTAHPADEIVSRTARLARAFRKKQLPVVLVHVTGTAPGRTEAGPPKISRPPDWADFAPELEQHPDDYVVTKQRWGAFLGTPLDGHLRSRGVTQIVLTGISTSAGVESTARSAYDLGYNVVFVLDAMTDRNAEAHHFTVEKIFPRLGETTSTDDLLKLLQERSPL